MAVILGCTSIFYFHGMWKKDLAFQELQGRLTALKKERAALMVEREDLQTQIQSEQDPAYIEMVLMKGLGMVPEGQHKVYFQR
jgi:hypothetical protein